MELIQAKQKDEALLQDIHVASKQENLFHLWWLGQSGFLLKWKTHHFLFDPYLSDSLTRKYAATEKPHVRMSELVIRPEKLDFIDVVTSTHNHTDHLDGETLKPLMQVNPEMKLIIPEANRDFVVNRLGCSVDFPIGLNDGTSTSLTPFTITGVPAAHETIERDIQGRCKFLGYILQFGNFCVYHSGDTLWFEGMETILEKFPIDIALLPINGKDPKRKVAGNLNAKEATQLGKYIGAKLVIPCHYDMFTFNTADPQDFAAAAEEVGIQYRILTIGERLTFEN